MEETVVVRATQGGVKGLKVKPESGATYYSFRGVPYAKPPVGRLRFRPPEPAEPWVGVLDATKEPPVAPQMEYFKNVYRGNEDCLYMNIYTPELPGSSNSALKPVLFCIHGGGYFAGTGNSELIGITRLIHSGEVVIVAINYRLGALGFLSTGDSVVLGNNGLKDQVLALKWVQENIAKFGGDPKNVTITGGSAGGSATHLHMFSPMSKGLFHKAMAKSGSALAPWSVQDLDVARSRAFRLGRKLGIYTEVSERLVKYLRTLPVEKIVEGTVEATLEEELQPLGLQFLPVVEQGGDPDSMFLSEKPLTLIRNRKFNEVPLITGVASREGLIIARDLATNKTWFNNLTENLEPVFVEHLNFKKGTSESKELTAKIKEYFFGDRSISKETWGELVDIFGDVMFNIWADKAVKEQAKVSDAPIYLYKFSYEGGLNVLPPEVKIPGANHAGDSMYIYDISIGPFNSKEVHGEDKKISDQLIKMWFNFVKTGNPTPEKDDLLGVTWTPYTKTDAKFLDIDKELTMQDDYFRERMQFWNDLLPDRTE